MHSASHRNPVLLIHGIFINSAVFHKMSAYLTELGWDVHALDLPIHDTTQGLEQMAERVADYANNKFGREQPLDIVGFSMGGLVSRYYVQRLGGIERVERLVAISSPHNGTWTANCLESLTSVQMRPGSAFLKDLNGDAGMLERLNFTSIWTDWDFIIVPAASSQMPVGKEVKVPVFAHPLMLWHPKTLEAVAETLRVPVKPDRQLVRTLERQK
ncbi:MAG: alpha/beta fold hydrolase [Oscillatoria princeps RMCB-10]|jgi:triacylglycerol lipase|nr:alpha/beta fold hydrolase [Oscillatoria princeps RMCB-10]